MIPTENAKIKTSNFYSKKKQMPLVFSRKLTEKQSEKISPKKKVKTTAAGGVNLKRKSAPSYSVKKTCTKNVFEEKREVLLESKQDNSPTKANSVETMSTGTVLVAEDLSKKRSSLEGNNDTRSPFKKQKLDMNMNKCNDDSNNTIEEVDGTISQFNSLEKTEYLSTENSTSVVKANDRKLQVKTGATKQQNLKSLIKTLNKAKVDTQFPEESFRILDESSQAILSPLLFSSSSSGLGSSQNNSGTSSPSQEQSSITRYFSSTRPETSPQATNGVSPRRGRNSKRCLGLGKDVSSPANSPAVSNKKAQMYLDLGQKDFGHVTCPTCNMVYTRAQPEDEADHLKFHQKFVTCLRFKGWKRESVVEHYDDGRVIVILPKDNFTHLKKACDVRSVVDNELGFSSETSSRMEDAQTFMFIINNKVVGCVVAVDIQQAYPILPSELKDKSNDVQGAWCCSSTPVRAQCGISRVWVLKQHRRQSIATRLLDCVRNHFIFGCVVGKEALAFSDPTPVGKQLAESYIGSDTFLVFR